jgi:CdiI N-terminal domain
MFKIFTTNESVPESDTGGAPIVYGKIVIDSFCETFTASLSSWTREQYDRHWNTALERLIDGADRSALITSYIEPPTEAGPNDFLVWWPLYRDGDTVYVQNHLLFFGKLKAQFLLERSWESLSDRQVMNDEGQKISEWVTTVQDIRNFLDSSKRRGQSEPSSY